MGLNLFSGHHSEVFEPEYGEKVAQVLKGRFGADVPLGSPGNSYVEPAQMGWPWWDQLQDWAVEKLGEDGSKHICAVDAWRAVYVDVPIEREVLWPTGIPDRPQEPVKVTVVTKSKPGPFEAIKGFLGLSTAQSEAEDLAQYLASSIDSTKSEGDGLQVSSLRGVLAEAVNLLKVLGIGVDVQSVRAALSAYEEDDQKVDDDPAVQCLFHLWLTATHALEHKQPMWLVK